MNKVKYIIFMLLLTVVLTSQAQAKAKGKKYSGLHTGGGGGYSYIMGNDFTQSDSKLGALAYDDQNLVMGGAEFGYMFNINKFIIDFYGFAYFDLSKSSLWIEGKGGSYVVDSYGEYGLNLRLGRSFGGFLPYGLVGVTFDALEVSGSSHFSESGLSIAINYGLGGMYSFQNGVYMFLELAMHSDMYTDLVGYDSDLTGFPFYLDVKMGGGIIF